MQCFELRVIDSRGKADLSPDSVCITVTNRAPVAYAGVDQDVLTGNLVQLDGTGSYDPDNDYRLKYLWIQTSGPNVSLSNNSVATPTFTAPGAPSTLTFALYVVDALDEPDLSPDTVQATRNNIRLVIRNQGNIAIQNGFFVDVYINPSPAPTRVNQTWLDLADQGMVWGVKGSALQALVPGASITLEYRDKYYLEEYSTFYGSLSPGPAIYAQVDSFNDPNTVLESHEKFGGEYNNILGPVGPTAAIANHSSMVHPTDPGWLVDPSVHPPQDALDTLPARP